MLRRHHARSRAHAREKATARCPGGEKRSAHCAWRRGVQRVRWENPAALSARFGPKLGPNGHHTRHHETPQNQTSASGLAVDIGKAEPFEPSSPGPKGERGPPGFQVRLVLLVVLMRQTKRRPSLRR